MNWTLNDDLRTVTITFPTDPPVALKLDVREVEEVLDKLGEFRALMTPEVERDYAPGQQVAVIRDPLWVTEPDALVGDSLIHLRDQRFGWLHYWVPRAEALKLSSALQAQADAPPPGQRSGKPY